MTIVNVLYIFNFCAYLPLIINGLQEILSVMATVLYDIKV